MQKWTRKHSKYFQIDWGTSLYISDFIFILKSVPELILTKNKWRIYSKFECSVNISPLNMSMLLFTIVSSLFAITVAATFYEEEEIEISQKSILKRWSGISRASCILRCRRNKDCQYPAIDDNNCLFLRNESSTDIWNGTEIITVTILKEIDTRKKPKGMMMLLSHTSPNIIFKYCTIIPLHVLITINVICSFVCR